MDNGQDTPFQVGILRILMQDNKGDEHYWEEVEDMGGVFNFKSFALYPPNYGKFELHGWRCLI